MGFPTSSKKQFTRSVTNNNKRHTCKFWNRRKTDGGDDGGGGGGGGDEAVSIMRRNTSFDSILSRQSLLRDSHGPIIEPSIISFSPSSLRSLPNEDLLKIEELNKVTFEKEDHDNRICYRNGDEDETDERPDDEFMKISRSPSFKVYVTQHDINDDKRRSRSNSKEDNTKMGELKNEEPTTSIDTNQVESTNNTPNKTNIWSRLRGILPKNKNRGMKSMFEAAVGCYTSNNSNGSLSDSDVVHNKKLSHETTIDDKPKD